MNSDLRHKARLRGRTIGAKIKEARSALSMGQAELAAILGVSIPIISEWENGRKSPSVERRNSIADALQVPVEELFAPGPVYEIPNISGSQNLSGIYISTLEDVVKEYAYILGSIDGAANAYLSNIDSEVSEIRKLLETKDHYLSTELIQLRLKFVEKMTDFLRKRIAEISESASAIITRAQSNIRESGKKNLDG